MAYRKNRKRVIIIGFNKKHFGKNVSKICDDAYHLLWYMKNKQRKTVGMALKGMALFNPIKKAVKINGKNFSHKPYEGTLLNSTPRFHNKRDISIFEILANDIKTKSFKYTSIAELQKLYTKKTGKKSSVHKYYVLREDKQSNTIPAHLYKDGLRHIHPDPNQARSITVREAARLQGFNDDFEFLGSIGAQYKMIGNAVPPIFAKHIANSVSKIL